MLDIYVAYYIINGFGEKSIIFIGLRFDDFAIRRLPKLGCLSYLREAQYLRNAICKAKHTNLVMLPNSKNSNPTSILIA